MAAKYWYGGAAGHQGQWDFGGIDPFNPDAGAVVSVNNGIKSGIPAAGHHLQAGDTFTLTGTDHYDGTYIVDAGTTADMIVIAVPYVLLSGDNSLVSGTQWTAAGIDLIASGVQAGMKIKLWDGETLIGLTYPGTNGIVDGTAFTASGVDFLAVGVAPAMTIKLWDGTDTYLGEFSIASVVDSAHLTLEQTGLTQSGLRFEVVLRDAETFNGLTIISVVDSGHLEIEHTGMGASGLPYEIIRGETFDGTEVVTPNVDSNWKLVADGSNTTKPADGDVLHFNDRAFYNAASKKYQSCTINVDSAGTGTPNLGGIFVSAGFNGTIGSQAVPLEINCQDGDIVIDGDCSLYLNLSAGADSDAGCRRLVVNNEKANVYVSSFLNNETYVCLYELLICLKGYLWILNDCAVGEVVSANYSSFINGGIGIENVKDQTPCSITAVKGELVWRSKINEIKLFDAEFAWGEVGMSPVVDYFCNLLTIYSQSGEFLWQMADTGTSLIKQFVLYAGNLIASATVHSGYQKKIGTGTEISELWPEATANLNSSSNNVLIAPGSKLEAHGGTLIASSGSLLGW